MNIFKRIAIALFIKKDLIGVNLPVGYSFSNKWRPIGINNWASGSYIILARIDHNDGLPGFKEIKINDTAANCNLDIVGTFDSKAALRELFDYDPLRVDFRTGGYVGEPITKARSVSHGYGKTSMTHTLCRIEVVKLKKDDIVIRKMNRVNCPDCIAIYDGVQSENI